MSAQVLTGYSMSPRPRSIAPWEEEANRPGKPLPAHGRGEERAREGPPRALRPGMDGSGVGR